MAEPTVTITVRDLDKLLSATEVRGQNEGSSVDWLECSICKAWAPGWRVIEHKDGCIVEKLWKLSEEAENG